MTRAYLDHASTTPLRPQARAALAEVLERHDLGDPGRLHAEGLAARALVEDARDRLAAALGVRAREVVFTSGATESIAMACYGATAAGVGHSVLAPVEHSAVRDWAARGPQTLVGVDGAGRMDPDEVAAVVTALGSGGADAPVALVHCQTANHEVGTRQPLAAVAAAVAGRALIHADAAQTAGREPLPWGEGGPDLVSVSGHKLGGPTGTGALLVRRGLRLPPLLVGGEQERARRAGMEHVAGVVGLAAAVEAAVADGPSEAARLVRLTGRVLAWADRAEGVTVHGDPARRAPHLVCLGLEGVEPQPVLIGLDRAGVAVHSGSSCSSESIEPSPVLEAMGLDAQRSLRISAGWSTTDADIDRLLDALPRVLAELRLLRR